ncbi:hypothetical protein LI328DRAFT_166248 [Trichoderma asperelloides]|nr:hypothetical protein LI328DRAFT_166248 [Trichoderma asperelloides]
MQHIHSAKRRRLDENIEPCIRQTVKNSTMSISSLIDQKHHHHHIPQPTGHSNSCGSALHAPQPTQSSASIDSSAPFGLLEQSTSQVTQASETKCAAPSRHFRPWEVSNPPNFSPAPDSYTTVPSPSPDLSSDDDFLSCEDDVQDPNTFTVSQANTEQRVMVCFGMVSGISGRCERPNSSERVSSFEVALDSSENFTATGDPRLKGRILSEHGQMIQGLIDESALSLHVSCIPNGDFATRKSSRYSAPLSCDLEITVYGSSALFEQIGIWFQEYGTYLQDPRACHHDVKYWNPHRLSSGEFESSPLLSQAISHAFKSSSFQGITEGPDLLDILSSNIELEEAPQPAPIQTTLQSHQKKALTFLLRRENGWAFDANQLDIWERVDNDQGRFFINRISTTHQEEEPPQFYGGIIADPMGLGKTLTMIALAASDLDGTINTSKSSMDIELEVQHCIAATLIIVPPPLLGTWEEQLSEHVVAGGLKWRRHYGKTKFTNQYELDGVNVVLTTYHTVSAEWKNGREAESSLLFSVRWKRIILDEAHFIRNGSSRMAHAICALDSVARWAVTGTPIQNRLGDLATLLKFIRVHPYTDPKRFDADIAHLWKSGEDEEAAKRLQRLSACILLRRPKTTINLPPRQDMRCPIDFSREERELYTELREQTIARIDEALQSSSERSRASVYVNVLQQIESLRLVCNLGLHYHARHQKAPNLPAEEASDWSSLAQQAFNVQRGMGPIVCVQCSSTLELTETLLDDSSTANQNPTFSRCLKFLCGDCMHRMSRAGRKLGCGHRPPCPTASVSINMNGFEDVSDMIPQQMKASSVGLPSKIEALIADVKTLPPDTKCIVFSTWRLTLDIIEAGLDQASLRCIRFDGRVPQKERQSVVESFKKEPTIRVMLLTLSCGAVGLTLTVASRAYLMEPHWNPTLEEQALARIHRIGQKQSVTTVRFYIRDSFEEQVMELQESKKSLAGVLLSPHDGGHTDDSLGTLQRLRVLI